MLGHVRVMSVFVRIVQVILGQYKLGPVRPV